ETGIIFASELAELNSAPRLPTEILCPLSFNTITEILDTDSAAFIFFSYFFSTQFFNHGFNANCESKAATIPIITDPIRASTVDSPDNPNTFDPLIRIAIAFKKNIKKKKNGSKKYPFLSGFDLLRTVKSRNKYISIE